jgi:hypothetical protein
MLLFELMLIRWLNVEIPNFASLRTPFLLCTCLGLGLGAVLAKKMRHLVLSITLLAVLITTLAVAQQAGRSVLRSVATFSDEAADLLLRSNGTANDGWPQAILTEASRTLASAIGSAPSLLLVAFVILSLLPFGQALGRLFSAHEQPLRAVGISLAGNLVGLLLLFLVTFLPPPPTVWLAAAGLGSLIVGRTKRWRGFV